MRLLLVADEEDRFLWDCYKPGCLDGTDMILSAGDLSADYLSFLVTMAGCPLLYVHGNHDGRYAEHPPEGCVCAEDRLVTVNGLRILGLGGSPRYNGGPHQYAERDMQQRIRRMRLALYRAGGVDIVLTHAPARDLGDQEDRVHRGFQAFRDLIDRYRPAYFVHGHVHTRYTPGRPRTLRHGDTTVVNACGKYWLEL